MIPGRCELNDWNETPPLTRNNSRYNNKISFNEKISLQFKNSIVSKADADAEIDLEFLDQTLREWAHDLNRIWRKLCRQITPDVLNNPDRHSLLYVPKSFVVSGGRFRYFLFGNFLRDSKFIREFYYWDAYWIIKGLLVSGEVILKKF